MCKTCNSDWVRGRYAKNKKSHYENVRRSRAARAIFLREMVAKIKIEKGCKDCGYRTHAEALEFDHLPQNLKIENVSILVAKGVAVAKILAEIEKCDVRCANCHRVITHKRRNSKLLGCSSVGSSTELLTPPSQVRSLPSQPITVPDATSVAVSLSTR